MKEIKIIPTIDIPKQYEEKKQDGPSREEMEKNATALIAMGFDEEKVYNSLKITENNLEKAVELLSKFV